MAINLRKMWKKLPTWVVGGIGGVTVMAIFIFTVRTACTAAQPG